MNSTDYAKFALYSIRLI